MCVCEHAAAAAAAARSCRRAPRDCDANKTHMSKFDLRAAFAHGNYRDRYHCDEVCGLKARPTVFIVDWWDGQNPGAGAAAAANNDGYPRFIRRSDSNERCDVSEYECGDILLDWYRTQMFIAPTSTASIAGAPVLLPTLMMFNSPPLNFRVVFNNSFSPSKEWETLDLTTMHMLSRAFLTSNAHVARRLEIILCSLIAPTETFNGFVPRATPRRKRIFWSVQLKSFLNEARYDCVRIELYNNERCLAVGDIGSAADNDDEEAARFHTDALNEFAYMSSLRQEALLVSGSTFAIHACEVGDTRVLSVGDTRLHVHRVRFRPSELPAEEKSRFVMLAPVGYRISYQTADRLADVELVNDRCASLYWAWPHYLLTEVAPVLLDAGLPAYCVLWVLDYLPEMYAWNELAKLETLLAVETSMRNVRAQRNA